MVTNSKMLHKYMNQRFIRDYRLRLHKNYKSHKKIIQRLFIRNYRLYPKNYKIKRKKRNRISYNKYLTDQALKT